MGDAIKLIGIVIIVAGFALKLDVLAVVLISGLITGLVSGLSFIEILRIIGDSFVSNRLMSIFLISFPVIAMLERYGLKERAAYLIGRIQKATSGKVLAIYLFIRTLAAAFSVRLGGHVQFVRPLIYPMAEAAGEKCKGSAFTEKEQDFLKGLAAAAENYGNFFGQNCFYGASGVLLIQGVLIEAGYEVTLRSIALNSIPVAVIMFILALVQFHFADSKIRKDGMSNE